MSIKPIAISLLNRINQAANFLNTFNFTFALKCQVCLAFQHLLIQGQDASAGNFAGLNRILFKQIAILIGIVAVKCNSIGEIGEVAVANTCCLCIRNNCGNTNSQNIYIL